MAIQVSPGVNITEVDLTTIVPAVSTTVGGLGGVFSWGPVGQLVQVTNENELVANFGKPTALNPETFFTAASFLNYGASLLVSRAANTTSADANAAVNGVATETTANAFNCVVKNADDYLLKAASFDANALYIAKYPSSLGNSLRIAVCDSTRQYSSAIDITHTTSAGLTEGLSTNNVAISGTFSISVGANTGSMVFLANTVVADANVYGNTVMSALTIGDQITVGNQKVQITGKTLSANSTAAVVSLTFANRYLGSLAYANTTTLARSWEFAGQVPTPTTSAYVASYGNSVAVDTLSVVVVDQGGKFSGSKGTVLESFVNVSRATDAKTTGGVSNYYKDVINTNSKYIWFGKDRTNASSATATNITSSTNLKPVSATMSGGQDGLGEIDIAFGDIATAYDKFQDDRVNVSLLMQGCAQPGSVLLANYMIDSIASVRKDVVAFITPEDAVVTGNPTNIAQALVEWRSAVRDSTYAVIDSGYKYMYDRYNNVYRYIPLNGDIAGLCARTDYTNDSWWSPAGFTRGQIKNIVKLRWNPSQADRDVLYANSINPVVSFPGQGTVLYGDKTATMHPSAFDRINVRRLFITLEKAVARASQYSLFQFNDVFTRSQFVNLVTPLLRNIQGSRGITEFLVVCDGTNNPPEVVDANQFVGDIYVKPNRSINFVRLNFVAVPTGVQFSTVVGQF
jgi:hypothetical protein